MLAHFFNCVPKNVDKKRRRICSALYFCMFYYKMNRPVYSVMDACVKENYIAKFSGTTGSLIIMSWFWDVTF